MVKRKMPANSHRNRKGTKKSEVKFLRVLFLISGISLSTLLYCIEDSRNYCIWLTMYALNVLASCIAFIQPKCTGKGHTLSTTKTQCIFVLAFSGHIFWVAWSIMSISINIFLQVVFCIHLLRAILAQQEAVLTFAQDDDSLYARSWYIWTYQESKECLHSLLLIAWMKSVNLVLRQKGASKEYEKPRPCLLFGFCGFHSLCVMATALFCSIFCRNDCLYIIGL